MAQKALQEMLEDLASKVKSLELEKRQAVAKIGSLEREKGEAIAGMQALERDKNEAAAKTKVLERQVTELARLIALASEKVEEILKIGANDEISQPPAVNMPEESKGQMQLGEFSADPQREPKGGSCKPWRSD